MLFGDISRNKSYAEETSTKQGPPGKKGLLTADGAVAQTEKRNTRIVAPSRKKGLPAEGTHTATLIEFEDLGYQPNPFDSGKERQRIKLVFELEDGSKQFHWLTPSLHPMSKFYELATALLAKNPPEALEVDDLVGLACLVELEHFKDGKGQQRSKIVEVRMLSKTRETDDMEAPF